MKVLASLTALRWHWLGEGAPAPETEPPSPVKVDGQTLVTAFAAGSISFPLTTRARTWAPFGPSGWCTDLADGTYAVSATAADTAGNVSPR